VIPISPQPEPTDFEVLVRAPGRRYIATNPFPTTKEWKTHAYWTRVLNELWVAYRGICAYGAHWIAPGEGNPTVDHFTPKSRRPDLAYEWGNYRLVSGRLNGRKGVNEDILDPFALLPGWFQLQFPSLLVIPNPNLAEDEKHQVKSTIETLKLNDDDTFVAERSWWLREYCNDCTNFDYLQRHAPFTAYELIRQDLVEKIKEMMRF
jgi:hypothetical protein